MSDIVFEEPPAARRPRGRGMKHREIAAKLQDRTGEWARIHTSTSRGGADAAAYQIRTGRNIAYQPPGSFEATARTVGGEFFVYARHVASDGAQA